MARPENWINQGYVPTPSNYLGLCPGNDADRVLGLE